MADPTEQRLRALELLQREGEPLTAYDRGTLAAIRRSGDPGIAARVDAVARVEASRGRKRARKPAAARRGEPSVFDRRADDDEATVLP